MYSHRTQCGIKLDLTTITHNFIPSVRTNLHRDVTKKGWEAKARFFSYSPSMRIGFRTTWQYPTFLANRKSGDIFTHTHPNPSFLLPESWRSKYSETTWIDLHSSPVILSIQMVKVEVQKGKSFARATSSLTTEIIQAQSQNASDSFE